VPCEESWSPFFLSVQQLEARVLARQRQYHSSFTTLGTFKSKLGVVSCWNIGAHSVGRFGSKQKLLLSGTTAMCLPSIYLMSPHVTKSPRPSPLYLHTESNQILEVGTISRCTYVHVGYT